VNKNKNGNKNKNKNKDKLNNGNYLFNYYNSVKLFQNLNFVYNKMK